MVEFATVDEPMHGMKLFYFYLEAGALLRPYVLI